MAVRDQISELLFSSFGFDGRRDEEVAEVEAVVDQLMAAVAGAWDAGYIAGHSNAMRQMSDEPDAPKSPNPYLIAGAS
jgi:hypothetical protein